MQKTEAAMILAGVTPEEQRQASAPTNLHVITGTVTGKSNSGKTQVSVDGLIFTADNSQHIEIDTLGGLEEGDVATILLTGENGHGMTPLAVGAPGSIDRIDVRIKSIEADYIKATLLEAEVAKLGYLSADSAVIQDLEAGKAYIDDLTANNITAARIVANSAYIKELELDGITTDKITATTGYIDDLTAKNITTGNIEAASGYIANLTAKNITADDIEAANGYIEDLTSNNITAAKIQATTGYIDDLNSANITASDISADHATVGQLDTTYATIGSLNAEQARVDNLLAGKASVSDLTAANGRIDNLQSTKADISFLESDYITADAIDATYLHADMSNADVAWIQNGVIKDGSISNAMINSLSANKLTAGTINGETINVTNINANNITAGTINGQRIGEGSLSLDKLSEEVYTEQEVDNKLATMQAEIDGAIETWTGTAVPTLNNSPASNWTTAAVRDTHVGDVYFVVNSQSEQNGYNYRFTKSGTTYSWQLIKDSDVTNALQRISTAEGKITTFDSDISTLKTDTGTLKTKTTSLETRMSDAEDDILDKVDTTTFNEVSDTVDQHSRTITQMSQTLSNKADGSTVTSLTQRVSKNEQDISGITTTIGELSTTVESKADGSTVESVSNRLNTVSNTVDGHTQSITNITSTQTTMQGKLDKTIVESTQLWYTKADTTAPNKPTSQVTSTSTSGGAWRTVVPAYSSSYPNYFYCYQWKYSDGTYGWSAVTRDIAMGESQSTSRTAASDASTAKATADKNVKSSVQLWYTKADETAPGKPTSKVTSTAVSGNGWRTVVPTYSSSYPNYFYCYQYELADGTYTWSDVVFDRATTENQSNSRGAVSGVSTLTSRTNEISNTVDGHTTQLSSITETQTTIQGSAVKSTVQLWFTKANTTAPSKPTAHVTTNNASTANAWNLAVPTYNSNYPYYYYCYEHQLLNDTYTWSAVTRDIATEESQSTSRSAKATADKNIKESQQLWYTKANSTAPAKPTSKVTSTATTGGAWTTRVPTYSSDYEHYFYCMQYVAADGTVTWSDVVYDQATTEAQSVARTASADLTEFHQEYATFKQTTQKFESTVGETYATKTELEPTVNYVNNAKANYGYQYKKDIVVYGESSKYYPIYFTNVGAVPQTVTHDIMIRREYSEQAPSDWYTSTHKGGLNIHFGWNFGGWGGATYKCEVYEFTEMYSTMVGDVLVGADAGMFSIVYLRGGGTTGALYHVYSDVPFTRHAYMTNAGVVGENDVPYIGLTQGTIYAQSTTGNNPTYKWTVRAPLTAPNTDHLNQLYTAKRAELIESRVSTAETSIIQTNEKISQKANASDVYTKTQTDGLISTEVNNRNSAIEQSARDIKISVSEEYTTKTEFNNLEIGGRNLLKYSRDYNGGVGYSSSAAESGIDGTYHGCSVWKAVKTATNAYNEALSTDASKVAEWVVGPDEDYVLSFWAKASAQLQVYSFFYLGGNNTCDKVETSTGYSGTATDGSAVTTIGTDWERYWVHWHFNSSTDPTKRKNLIIARMQNTVTGTIWIAGPKLEKGIKATDWSPAPEDVDAQISAAKAEIKVTTDGISSTVSKISSAKYVTANAASWPLASIKTYAAEGHSEGWNVDSTDGLRVGDIVYVKGTDSDRTCTIYIKTTVTSVENATHFTGVSHGYEDVLPVDSIKSTINQSSDSVKIQAKHVDIEGAAIFTSGRLTDANITKTANGIPDTRNNNQPPSWYFTNYPQQSVTEFKTSSVMGLTGETYCYVTTVTGWYNTSGGYPKQTAQIGTKTYWRVGVSNSTWSAWQETESTTGAQDKVNALEIGGRNLLPGTETLDGFVASVTNITFADGVLTMPGNASGWDNAHTPIVPFSKVDGSDITVSFEYQADVATYIYICAEGLATDAVKGARTKYKDHQYDLPATSEWTRWSTTFPNMSLAYLTQGSGDVNYFRLALYDRTNNSNLKVRFPKMEKGNKATDWSPAPEDQLEYADKLNSITTYSDTYKKFKNPAYLSLSGSHTGALIITTPILPSHMVTLKIDGYNYTGGSETLTMDISFYNYTTNFHQYGYANYGTRVITPVRFAKVSSSDKRAVVIIGDVNTTWSYPKVAVREAMISYEVVPDSYADGWTMSIATELPSSYIEITTCTNNSNFKLATSVSERIYYRSNSSTKPSAPTSWVADATQNVWNAWTTKVPPLAANKESGSIKYLYLWTCEQRKDVSGAFLGCTAVQLDENTTVIDGGTIITGSVSANAVSATSGTFAEANIPNLSASKITTGTIAIGRIPDAAKNENVVVGGRNFLLDTASMSGWTGTNGTTISEGIATFPTVTANTWRELYPSKNFRYSQIRNQTVVFSAKVMAASGSACSLNLCIGVDTDETAFARKKYRNQQINFTGTGSWTTVSAVANVTDSWFNAGSGTVDFDNCWVTVRPGAWNSYWPGFQLKELKLELGNKATDWSPAPEDVTNNINAVADATADTFDSINTSISGVSNSLKETDERLANLTQAVTDSNEERAKWIRADSTGLTIGETGSNYNLYLDNDSVDFKLGTETVATASIEAFVPTALRLGDYVLSGSSDGYLYIDYQPKT